MVRYIRSVAKKYPVRLPDGSYTKFANGEILTKTKAIAGAGTNVELRCAILLESNYHQDRTTWSKWRGESYVYINHKVHRVELHWYVSGKRNYEYKVKVDFDEME